MRIPSRNFSAIFQWGGRSSSSLCLFRTLKMPYQERRAARLLWRRRRRGSGFSYNLYLESAAALSNAAPEIVQQFWVVSLELRVKYTTRWDDYFNWKHLSDYHRWWSTKFHFWGSSLSLSTCRIFVATQFWRIEVEQAVAAKKPTWIEYKLWLKIFGSRIDDVMKILEGPACREKTKLG